MLNRFRKLLKKNEEASSSRNHEDALMMVSAASYLQRMDEENSQWGGSSGGRAYIQRDREDMDRRLKDLYFNPMCRFDANHFRRRYRMRPELFEGMMRDVANYDPYFVQTMDASGRVGFSTEQKLTCAMRMLAYGLPADLCDEFLAVAESSALEILDHFTRAIWNVYHNKYLRSPEKADLIRLLKKADDRGFPGMVGSLDCMHWQWKNCPTAWQGQYQGYKGSLNDLNVLARSPLFNDVCQGKAHRVKYRVGENTYTQAYYLVDGIYPNWGTLIKAIPNPTTPETRHFTRMQEAYRKDVERAFGILQARFAIVRGPARLWNRESLQYIMMTYIILHNMIVEDERDEDEPFDIDDIPTRPRRAEVYDRADIDQEVHRNPRRVREYVQRYDNVRCPVIHDSLRDNLVRYGWNKHMESRRNNG